MRKNVTAADVLAGELVIERERRMKFLRQIRAEIRGTLNTHVDNIQYLHSRLKNWEKRVSKEIGV